MNKNKLINHTLKGNLEVFIVPNHAHRIKDFMFEHVQENFAKTLATTAELNGFRFNPETDLLVEVWFTGMNVDNLTDHALWANDEDGNRICITAFNNSHLPVSIFEGKKEGDTIHIKLPALAHRSVLIEDENGNCKDVDDVVSDVIIDADVTLAQSKYRYCRFGNFEDALLRVTR